MWQFLARGESVANVIDGLRHLLSEAANIEGAAGTDQVVQAQRYLRWSENAERRLQGSFADPTIARSLLTSRHWQIRAIEPSTRMAFGMIESELRDQARVLRSLLSQIEHYVDLVQPSEDETLVVLDTNVYVHGQPFDQVRWEKHVSGANVRLLMPLIVVDELDKLKDRSDSARGVLRSLDAVFAGATSLARLHIRDTVTLQLLDEPLGHVRLDRADDEIVRQVAYYSAVAESPVTIFTRDRGMRIRALASGVDARMLPPELERNRQRDDQ